MSLPETNHRVQRPHSTYIRMPCRSFNQNNTLKSSGSMPISCFGNFISFQSSNIWGSLTESSNLSSPSTSPNLNKGSNKVELDSYTLLEMKKNNFSTFYENKAAELVAFTIDTATKRCFSHLLWEQFNKFIDQPVNTYIK